MQTSARISARNDLQRAPASDHNEYFSVAFPDSILASPWLQSMIQTAQNVAEVFLTAEEQTLAPGLEPLAIGHPLGATGARLVPTVECMD